MPTSDLKLVSAVLYRTFEKKPSSILDVGIGFGKYGVLCREYGDVWYQRYEPKDWQVKIDGIEIFGKYENPNWENYNSVTVGDIRKLDLEQKYDIILLCDVLEHMSKKEAFKVLDKCLKKGKRVIVTTPLGKTEQTAVFGNKYERHICGFVPDDFKKYSKKAAVFDKVFMVMIDGKA